ncbi:MAG: hypothetical protein JSV17_11340 [Candidatus Aminicenantes bacterium]|nr:MAG: hypothetical protein JSV17_11340 [Candidatus Aminicenantes bacterium]
MNRGVWTLVIVILCAGVCVADEQGFPLVSGICLVENEAYQKGLPPGKITIGLQVRSDAFFKISFKDQVLRAGLFLKGFNTIALPSPDFFRKTDTHRFILECKSDESVVSKEIVIDIRIAPIYLVQKKGEERKQHVYTLSFLIGDRLVYSKRKFSSRGISFKLELPPWEGRYNPFGLIDGTQKPVTGISILSVAAGLYHLAKSLSPAEETKGEDVVPQKKQQIETTFLKTNVSGDLWHWRALISIKTMELEKSPISIP